MTHTIVQYGKSLNADTDRHPSPALWGNCPILEFQLKKNGYYFFDDFTGDTSDITLYTTATARGPYLTLQDTGVTITGLATPSNNDAGQVVGELEIAGNDADNDEGQIEGPGGGITPVVSISDTAGANKEFWFEARVSKASIADNALAFFIGIAEVGITGANGLVDDTGALADKDFIGFQTLHAAGETVDAVHREESGAVVQAGVGVGTMVADTYMKLGMYFDGTRMYWYVNGVKVAPVAGVLPAATSFPDASLMTMAWLTKVGAAAESKTQLDWWGVAQRYSAEAS